MGLGDGIAIFSVCAVIIAAILRFRKSNNPGHLVSEKECHRTHGALDKTIERIDNNIKRIFEILDDMRAKK